MRRGTWVLVAAACATVLGILTVSHTVSVQGGQPEPPPPPSPAIYNPYPPGILPDDLESEIARVDREINGIFLEALQEWLALPPPILQGNPPTLRGTGYQMVQVLGKLMNFDESMSPFRNRACAFCHMPYVAFSGPIPSVNLTMVAYPGSLHFRAGKRTAQRYTYSPRFPVLQFNEVQQKFFGGNFWDARATGFLLQNPDAEQAQHPPVDTQEHAFPDTACVALRLSQAVYRPLFELVWGKGSLDIKFPKDTEKICDTPGGAAVFGGSATPIPLSPADRTKANETYNHWGQSISAYEASTRLSAFSSKFDAFLKGDAELTADEMAGYELFRGKANCSECHFAGTGERTDTGEADDTEPLFTDFDYDNLGLPLNPRVAFYYQTTPDAFGFTPNPLGFGWLCLKSRYFVGLLRQTIEF